MRKSLYVHIREMDNERCFNHFKQGIPKDHAIYGIVKEQERIVLFN